MFTAIVCVPTTGCAWRHLPAEFGVSKATAHRRLVIWTEVGLWRRPYRAVLDRLGEQAATGWCRAVVDAASRRAETGARRPARTRSTAASPAPSCSCPPTPQARRRRSRSAPPTPTPRADPAAASHPCDPPAAWTAPAPAGQAARRQRLWLSASAGLLRRRQATPRIGRRGIETGGKLGRHRWTIERSLAWPTGYRRLTLRHQRSARLFTAVLTLAAMLTCYKKLTI